MSVSVRGVETSGKGGSEVLEEVLKLMAGSNLCSPTIRMRAALALTVLDGFVDLKITRVIGEVINGTTV